MRKLLNWVLPILLVGIGVFVSFRNYTPGTWLLGWDNLVPELNFKLNIARSLSATWQEYQGLGLLGGMAHGADLPRQLILWCASLLLPTSFLRYFWTFAMLTLGPLGAYFLVGTILEKSRNPVITNFAAFAGAIFYLFNLATLQVFYTPFETFTGFYGFMPWLLFAAANYLRHGGRGRLLVYALVSILATCAFYVQTLFIVYSIFLFVLAIEIMVRLRKKGLSRAVKLGLTTLLINAFWLLPVTYFAITSGGIPGASHINSIATPETQLMNQARGGFTNVATLKGYWFDYFDWSASGTYDYLYKAWIVFENNFLVNTVSIGLFLLSMVGLALSLVKRKIYFGASFLFLGGLAYFMLDGGSIRFLPLLSEAFRNAFTKWSSALALTIAVGLAIFVYAASSVFRSAFKYFVGVILTLVVVGTSLYTLRPVLSGGLIAGSMKVSLPSYYLETVDYLKAQDPSRRVAMFPLTDFWGWQFNDWGYRGSGFLWYGVPQPILSRSFDVWSPKNEAFYTEVSQAVNSKNLDDLNYVLNKYEVGYIVYDDSIYEPGSTDFSRIESEKRFLESSSLIAKEKEIGKITIYSTSLGGIDSFVSAPKVDYGQNFVDLKGTGTVPIVQEQFLSSQGYSSSKNCNLKGVGSVVKEKRDGGNYYKAEEDGVSCDYFYYPTFDSSKAYLMRIRGQNLAGRSLKIYLYDVSRKLMVLEELLPQGNFDAAYYVLPAKMGTEEGSGYTLNVETRSFGKISSENLIDLIEFYPVDFGYSQPQNLPNSLIVKSVKKYGTWGYKTDVEGYGTIMLGQGYDEGWLGLRLNGSILEVLPHKMFDSWANAWHVSSGQSQSTVYLVYWPQLLEWGGMILGILALLTLVRRKL